MAELKKAIESVRFADENCWNTHIGKSLITHKHEGFTYIFGNC